LIPTLFLFCAFSGKMVIQKTKKKSFFFKSFPHVCIIKMFISIIKSCINKPVEHLNHVLSLDFEFLVSETEEKDDEEVSNVISRLLGHLVHRSCKYQERLSRRGLSCTKTCTRCFHLPAGILYFKCTL
jgi:hypothetical protein